MTGSVLASGAAATGVAPATGGAMLGCVCDAGAAARAARTAAVAAACRLMAPVMSSTLLWSTAMRPASRSRSAFKARTCSVNIWVSNSSWAMRGGICATPDGSLTAKIERRRSVAVWV